MGTLASASLCDSSRKERADGCDTCLLPRIVERARVQALARNEAETRWKGHSYGTRPRGEREAMIGLLEPFRLAVFAKPAERITRDPAEVMDELRQIFLEEDRTHERILETAREMARIFIRQPIMIMVVNSDGQILFVNDFTADHMRWAKAQLVGFRYQTFVHPDDLRRTEIVHTAMNDDAVSGTFTNRWKTGDGGFRHLLWFSSRWIVTYSLAMAVPVDLCESTSCPLRLDADEG